MRRTQVLHIRLTDSAAKQQVEVVAMPALYNVLLLVHILAVVAWVGSIRTIGGLTALLVARREHAELARLLRTSMTYGAAIAGPSAVVTLLAGMGMMGVARLEPQLWMLWGFASIVLSIATGVGFTRRTLPEVIRWLRIPRPTCACSRAASAASTS
jgi:hypothetical protein